MNRMILPVAIAADDEETARYVLLRPVAEFVPLVREACIRVIIVFARAVRTDERRSG